MSAKASAQTSAGSDSAWSAWEWPCGDEGQSDSGTSAPQQQRAPDTVCAWGGYRGWPWQGDMEWGVSLAQEQGEDNRDSGISSRQTEIWFYTVGN